MLDIDARLTIWKLWNQQRASTVEESYHLPAAWTTSLDTNDVGDRRICLDLSSQIKLATRFM